MTEEVKVEETKTDKEPKGYQPTARDQAVEALAEARHTRMMEELGAAEPTETVEPEVKVEPVEPEVKPEAPKAEDQVTKQMRKVRVDGAEIEVSDEDLVASYQKQATATQRLAAANTEAARILAEAKAQAEQIKTPVVPEDRAAKVKEYHDALVTGDMETAASLFDEVMAGRQQPIPDVNEIISKVTPVVQQKLSNESALARFETDYKDIIDDPYLVIAAQAELRKLEAEGKPYAEALIAAGNHARDWLKSKLPVTAPEQPTTTRAEKLDKKGGIVNFPTVNSKATSTAEPEQSTSDIIAEFRRKRGQS